MPPDHVLVGPELVALVGALRMGRSITTLVPLEQARRSLLGTQVETVGEVDGDDRRGCRRTHGPVGHERRRRPEREVRQLALPQLVPVDEGVEAIALRTRP
jgi:hypothetical protein